MGRWHFSGVAGAGMNPLAQLIAHRGQRVSGSDRAFDAGQCTAIRQRLEDAGVSILAQDGSAIASDVERFIYSAAVEATTPEMQAAQAQGIAAMARPALLAEMVAGGRPGLAVAGTSGKSTIVGMLAWIVRQLNRPATVLGGAALAEGGAQHMGCFLAGPEDGPVIAEACESDGTLVGYQPAIGLIHNITRDHAEVAELRQQFAVFAEHSRQLLINADDDEVLAVAHQHPGVVSYAMDNEAAQWRLQVLHSGPWRAQATLIDPDQGQYLLEIPQPGLHNLANALAATVAAVQLGIPLAQILSALATFPGVARRFQVLGKSDQHITVIDDYAHNGAKIAAAISAAQQGCDRLLAFFQPHGFAPTRFLRPELKELLPRLLRPGDRFCYGEIFYAGGTVQRDLSAAELAADIGCDFAADHLAAITWACEHALPGNSVLIMGARDPRLGDFAHSLLEML